MPGYVREGTFKGFWVAGLKTRKMVERCSPGESLKGVPVGKLDELDVVRHSYRAWPHTFG